MNEPESGTAKGAPEAAAEPEQQMRANVYALLAALLVAPPDAALLKLLERIGSSDPGAAGAAGAVDAGAQPDGPLGQAWLNLREAAVSAAPDALAQEYQILFVGIGRGEVVPYGSWYQTGFLMDQPLSMLRADLQTLGLERRPGVFEPEDHVSALFEVMSVLVRERDLTFQSQFFDRHLAGWIALFFKDLKASPSAVFYRPVASLGLAYCEFEHEYLHMLA